MSNIIAGHNKKILNSDRESIYGLKGCNCIDGIEFCPLQGRCQSRGIVYKGVVKSVEEEKEYIGQTTTTFKLRYGTHKNTFGDRSKKTKTGLSKHMWELKRRGVEADVEFDIITCAMPRAKGASVCDICITEKTLIARADPSRSLNKRNEVMNPCRHLAPLMLSNYHSVLPPHEELAEEEDSDATQDEGSDIEELPDPPDPLVLPDPSVPDPSMLPETFVLPDQFVLPEPVVFPDTFVLPNPSAVLNPFVLPHHYVLPDTVVPASQAPFDPGANVADLEISRRRMTRSEARRRKATME